jgi:hypothetical protein
LNILKLKSDNYFSINFFNRWGKFFGF